MIKKNSWIVVLLLALSLTAFFTISCVEPYVPPVNNVEDNTPFEFDGSDGWDGIFKPFGTNPPEIDGNEISITASSSTGFWFNFADIGYELTARKLKFYYEIEVTTPAAVITAKYKNGDNLDDIKSPAAYGKGKGLEYQLDSATRSNYDGPLVAASYDDATKSGWFEVYMAGIPSTAKAMGFQHNVWADTDGDGTKIAEDSVYKLTITKIEKVMDGDTPEPPPEPEVPDDFPPTINNATMIGDVNDKEWGAINDYMPDSKYFIIASVGGGTENGFNGFQPHFQGAGSTDQILTTGNFTALAHTATEVVYFIFDLSEWPNYTTLQNAAWAQFRINYGDSVLGTFAGYIVDGTVSSLTKPAGAVDFALEGTEDKPLAPGYATKTLPVELQ